MISFNWPGLTTQVTEFRIAGLTANLFYSSRNCCLSLTLVTLSVVESRFDILFGKWHLAWSRMSLLQASYATFTKINLFCFIDIFPLKVFKFDYFWQIFINITGKSHFRRTGGLWALYSFLTINFTDGVNIKTGVAKFMIAFTHDTEILDGLLFFAKLALFQSKISDGQIHLRSKALIFLVIFIVETS